MQEQTTSRADQLVYDDCIPFCTHLADEKAVEAYARLPLVAFGPYRFILKRCHTKKPSGWNMEQNIVELCSASVPNFTASRWECRRRISSPTIHNVHKNPTKAGYNFGKGLLKELSPEVGCWSYRDAHKQPQSADVYRTWVQMRVKTTSAICALVKHLLRRQNDPASPPTTICNFADLCCQRTRHPITILNGAEHQQHAHWRLLLHNSHVLFHIRKIHLGVLDGALVIRITSPEQFHIYIKEISLVLEVRFLIGNHPLTVL